MEFVHKVMFVFIEIAEYRKRLHFFLKVSSPLEIKVKHVGHEMLLVQADADHHSCQDDVLNVLNVELHAPLAGHQASDVKHDQRNIHANDVCVGQLFH